MSPRYALIVLVLAAGCGGGGKQVPQAPVPPQDQKRFDEALLGLKSPDAMIRRYSLQELLQVGKAAKPALPTVIALTKDADAGVRSMALEALGSIGDPSAIPVIQPFLKHKDFMVRGHAARVLINFGPAAKPTLPDLLPLLGDSEQFVWGPTVQAIAAMGPGIAADLESALKQGRHADQFILWALRDCGADAEVVRPVFTRYLHDAREDVRRAAAFGLKELGEEARPSIPELLRAVRGGEGQDIAAEALAATGPPGLKATTDLLRNGEPEERVRAMYALLAMKADAEPALPELVAALHGSNTWGPGSDEENEAAVKIRGLVERSLRQIGTPSLPPLISMLKDPLPDNRGRAALVIGLIGNDCGYKDRAFPESAVLALADAATDSDLNVRSAVAGALQLLGAQAAPAEEALRGLLRDELAQTAGSAKDALAKIEGAKTK